MPQADLSHSTSARVTQREENVLHVSFGDAVAFSPMPLPGIDLSNAGWGASNLSIIRAAFALCTMDSDALTRSLAFHNELVAWMPSEFSRVRDHLLGLMEVLDIAKARAEFCTPAHAMES